MSYFDNGGYFPRQAPPPITRYGWDNNLSAMPKMEFDDSLSNDITSAQLMAGLSVADGALVADLGAMIAAGASAGARAVAWVTPRVMVAPVYMHIDGQIVTSSGGGSGREGYAGVGWWHFADAEPDTPPSPPPGGAGPTTGSFLSYAWGINAAGARGGRRWLWASSPAGQASNVEYHGAYAVCAPLDMPNAMHIRTGSTYPPTGSSSASGGRNSGGSGQALAAAHRLRLALLIEIADAGCVAVATMKKLDAQWRPA